MIRIAKSNTSIIEQGRRILKSFVRSKRDVQTSFFAASWGDDSCPVDNSDVLHSATGGDDTVIIGVINQNQKTNPGEKRIFATDANGAVVVDIYLRNDGSIEVAGTGDNLVKYIPLNAGLQTFITNLNAELAIISAAVATKGVVYTPTVQSIDISGAKIDNLKTA